MVGDPAIGVGDGKTLMTIIIQHPPDRAAERAYIFDVMFREFLGLEFATITEDRDDIVITCQNSSLELRVVDIFFRTAEADWLQPQSLPILPLALWQLPNEITQSMNTGFNSVPVLFGKCTEFEQFLVWKNGNIDLNVDIFGSAFFMLTRYEEACDPVLDDHARFPAHASVAGRAGFIERPIVNEYLDILWVCLRALQPRLSRAKRQYELVVSHDVDRIFDTRDATWLTVFKNAIGDIAKRKDVGLAAKRIRSKVVSGDGNYSHEPCNSFDFIMGCSEQYNIRSAFYFIAHQGVDGFDSDYSIDMPWVRGLIRHIHARGHELGLHASYNSYTDHAQIAAELAKLRVIANEEGVNQDVWGGRQHYLRWAACTTWQGWEDAGLAYDSTLTFPEAPGFRSGTCFEYPVFNLRERNMLRLRERPLVVMETSLFSEKYMNLSTSSALDAIERLSGTCRRFGGKFTLLWHNDNLVQSSQKRLYLNTLEVAA